MIATRWLRSTRGGLLLVSLLFPASCATVASTTDAPHVLILGTAQDGGLPQIACRESICARAREDASLRRRVASLLIVNPATHQRWLIDATPDFPEQVELADRHAPREVQPGRPALFDGIFLTHAHFGHYTGLAYLGREVYGSQPTEVFGSASMGDFLENNGPWDLLLQAQHIQFHTLREGAPVQLAPGLSVSAFRVPHRDEYTDTLGFRVQGPERSLVYIPDIDKWSVFDQDLGDLVRDNDYALLDGSFFADGEIPGRAMSEIPHPFMAETMEQLAALPASERAKVFFTHLNHTNPASTPGSAAQREVQRSGSHVARDGQVLEL